jgi:hypothetical protein
MTDKPPPKDEPGVQERFERGLKNALATPPRPHKVQPDVADKKSSRGKS